MSHNIIHSMSNRITFWIRAKSQNIRKSVESEHDFVNLTRKTFNFLNPTILAQLTRKLERFSRSIYQSRNMIRSDRNLTTNAPLNPSSSQNTNPKEVRLFSIETFSFQLSFQYFLPNNSTETVEETSSSSENSPSNVSRKHKPSYPTRKSAKASAMMKRHVRSSSGYSSHNEETTFR